MHPDAYAQGLKFSSQGRHLDAISCFEQALALKPNDVGTLFALGNTARALGLHQPAAEFFRKVLAQEPGRIEALVNLANLLRTQGQFESARALLEPAVACNPQSAELLLSLGSAWREAGDAERAKQYYRDALDVRPDYALALSNLADLLANDGDIEIALDFYNRAIKAEKSNAQIRLNRAILHLLKGDLAPGWRDYEARVDVPNKVPMADLKLREWRGETLDRTRLLVRAEQGVGDQLMFMSLVPDIAQQGQVILECEPRLVALATRSFPTVTVKPWSIATTNGIVRADYGWLNNAGGANSVVLMGSLPRWLRRSLDAFPREHSFLTPDPAEQARWKEHFTALGTSPLIGICWRSGKMGGHRSVQYAPLEQWGTLLRDLPGTIISCQYDAGTDEIARLEQLSGRRIFVPPALDQKYELDRTTAMLSSLNMLISAPTAVSWLAAGAGVKTFKLLYHLSWTAFGQAYEPFAPAARCVSPKKPGDWNEVFAEAIGLIARV
jgi:Flp pilus assembly protein TadD